MKHGKMSWLMMAGCGLMVIGLVVLPALGVRLGGALSLLLVVMCPLSHVLMMGMMSKGHRGEASGTTETGGHIEHASAGSQPVGASTGCPAPAEALEGRQETCRRLV